MYLLFVHWYTGPACWSSSGCGLLSTLPKWLWQKSMMMIVQWCRGNDVNAIAVVTCSGDVFVRCYGNDLAMEGHIKDEQMARVRVWASEITVVGMFASTLRHSRGASGDFPKQYHRMPPGCLCRISPQNMQAVIVGLFLFLDANGSEPTSAA